VVRAVKSGEPNTKKGTMSERFQKRTQASPIKAGRRRDGPYLYRFMPHYFFECGVPRYGNSLRTSVWGLRPVGGH
jgi:hypothetical protein